MWAEKITDINNNTSVILKDAIGQKKHALNNEVIENIQKAENPATGFIISDRPSRENINLTQPTVIII